MSNSKIESYVNKTCDQSHREHANTTITSNGRHKVNQPRLNGQIASTKEMNNPHELKPDQNVKVSDIIGDFGPYQIAVVIFAALRALSCAMDGLSGPFISPNIRNFQCDLTSFQQESSMQHDFAYNSTSNMVCFSTSESAPVTCYELEPNHCFLESVYTSKPDRIYCKRWLYNNPDNEGLMNSLTIEQNLVCNREWLKSLSNSMYFVGATLGLLFWGFISDKYGRKTSYVCSHFVSMIFGLLALFANDMTTYVILRSLNAFGMIGELIPRSIQVEIVATEYRFICSVVCQIGWTAGILLVPITAYINPGYRVILAIPVIGSFLMLPWLIWLPESARWLIANHKFDKARAELRRAAKINGKLDGNTDSKIEQYNRQVLSEEGGSQNGEKLGVLRSIMAIFTNDHLMRDTMAVFALLFVAEVVYFSLTLNVADLGGSLYLNYLISGLSELVSIAMCGFLLAYLSRRMCLSLLLLASTVSYLLMALVNIFEQSLPMVLILGVNAFGKLTAIANLMVIILVSQEVFPTVIRQFGTSLCITVGKAGSAVAPFTHELGQIIGHSYCFAVFSIICLTCALIPFFLSETGNRELPDTVGDVEKGKKRPGPESRDKLGDMSKQVNSIEPKGCSNGTKLGGLNHFDQIMLTDIGNRKKSNMTEDDMNNNNTTSISIQVNGNV